MEFRTQSNLQLKVFIILWHHTNDLHEYEFFFKKYVFKDEKTSRASYWTQNCVSTFHHLLETSYVNSPSPFLSLLIIFVYWLTWLRISICKNFILPHTVFSPTYEDLDLVNTSRRQTENVLRDLFGLWRKRISSSSSIYLYLFFSSPI